jgi:type IV fimbrial biogenesis protein FimT
MTRGNNKISVKQGGYTLLEALVTMAIALLLTVMAVPSMSGLVANSRQTSGTNELLIAINVARSEALKRHRHVTICKSANGSTCGTTGVNWHDGWIVFANSSSANVSQRESGEELLYVSPALGGDADIQPNTAAANFISFRPNGRSATSGLFTWCDSRGSSHARGLIVLPSGSAAVSKTQVDGSALVCSGGS